jgi:RNA polymerase sigma-70 factor (ECF subfamily)
LSKHRRLFERFFVAADGGGCLEAVIGTGARSSVRARGSEHTMLGRQHPRSTRNVSAGHLQGASDPQLMVAVGRFRQDALAEIYRRHAGAAFGLARRVMGNTALAEEVLQEVFLQLWNTPDRFDPGRGSLRSYLLAITHGRSVDFVRAERSRRDREQREARFPAEAASDLEREVAELIQAEHVREALNTLNEAERLAIELAYFGGHTYREVARLLHEPEGTVKSRIRAGLQRLRAALVEHGITEPWQSN